MQTGRPLAPFEVHCGRCDVTFPVGTRRCVHCGGPTGPRREAEPRGARLGSPPEPGPEAELEGEPDPLGRVQPRAFSPLTLLWIALLVGGYAMRTCTGQ